MLIGNSTSPRKRTAILLAAVLGFLLPAGLWYVLARCELVDWPIGPGAAGFSGFVCGLIAGAIVWFEMGLWVRKRLRGWRRLLLFPLGSAKLWLWLHVWLGLLAIPLAIIHSGFRPGPWWSLGFWTLGLFLLVSASGIWGLFLQQWMPRYLLDTIPEETIAAQINHVMDSQAKAAERLVLALTTPSPALDPDVPAASAVAVRIRPLTAPSVASRLREFFDHQLAPYLKDGRDSRSDLCSPDQARLLLERLRQELPEHALEHARELERLCDVRRQLDRQSRLHAWLHGWLLVHVPLSMALLVLLTWHALLALKLW